MPKTVDIINDREGIMFLFFKQNNTFNAWNALFADYVVQYFKTAGFSFKACVLQLMPLHLFSS